VFLSLLAVCGHGAFILLMRTLPKEVTMGRKLYVGNLPYSATEQSLREAFAASGTVDSVSLITDRDTGQSKGFAFVEMSSDSEAQTATQEMNGKMLDGRQIKVNEAKPRENRGGGGGGNRGGGGGGFGGGGGGYGRRY
jgi:cold-inducible RNA-binding protein